MPAGRVGAECPILPWKHRLVTQQLIPRTSRPAVISISLDAQRGPSTTRDRQEKVTPRCLRRHWGKWVPACTYLGPADSQTASGACACGGPLNGAEVLQKKRMKGHCHVGVGSSHKISSGVGMSHLKGVEGGGDGDVGSSHNPLVESQGSSCAAAQRPFQVLGREKQACSQINVSDCDMCSWQKLPHSELCSDGSYALTTCLHALRGQYGVPQKLRQGMLWATAACCIAQRAHWEATAPRIG